jgi:hypothetical protein
MGLLLDIAFIAVFVAALVVAPLAWFRMLKAKTRAQYFKAIALFVLPILVTFSLGNLSSFKSPSPVPQAPAPAPTLEQAFSGFTFAQGVLLALAAVIWIGGGNLLLWRIHRRAGRSFWSAMNPLNPPFRDFVGRDWVMLAALAAASMVLGSIALGLGQGA